MKRTYLILILSALLLVPAGSHARRLYYAEEFYLYVMNLYQVNPSLERNIRFMQWALDAPFDNPVRSLARIETQNDFIRYKTLFRMHANLLIIDSSLQLARRFDKQHVYFFNLWYAESLKESFQIARYYYQIGLNYWDEVKKYAQAGGELPGRIDLDEWEDELSSIQNGELDYGVIITSHLEKLDARIRTVDAYLNQFPSAKKEQHLEVPN
jgi:hypothetical protein